MYSLSRKQLRILKFLRDRGGWATRREMEFWAGKKGFSKALGTPTRQIKPDTLEALGYVKRRDMTQPFEYQLTELGERALSDYERAKGPVGMLTYRTEKALKHWEEARQRIAALRSARGGESENRTPPEIMRQALAALVDAFLADERTLLTARLELEAAATAEGDRPAADASDNDAHRLLSYGMRAAELCLQSLSDSLADGDASAAADHCQQAARLVSAMRQVQEVWPWTDLEAIERSWQQYERGELMDFETFKHELLKVAE